MRRSLLLAGTLLAAPSAQALDLWCVESPHSLRNICYVPPQMKANGDLRSSPLFMGGPKDVHPTSFTIVVNCKTLRMTLQNREGVNVESGQGDTTAVGELLTKKMCAEPKTRPDKTLRQ